MEAPATEPAAAPEEEEEIAADLSSLRWQCRDRFGMGVTFYGSIADGRFVLEARRLAEVPLRFALTQKIEFADLATLLTAMLEAAHIRLGPEKHPVAPGPPSLTVGEYPLFRAPADETACGYLRKTAKTAFEIEVPWQHRFGQWTVAHPIL